MIHGRRIRGPRLAEAAPCGLYAAGGSPPVRAEFLSDRKGLQARSVCARTYIHVPLRHSAQLVHTHIGIRFVRSVAGGRSSLPQKLRCGCALLAIAVLGAAGCGGSLGSIARAPFRLRADTTVWGSLLGPFDGTVVEQSTGSPIAGALVVATWAFETEDTRPVPAGTYSTSVVTSPDGSYALPSLPLRERRLSLLRRFTLQVYKAGFVGYRSDYRADDLTPRHDFCQLGNKARLDRLTTGESRVRNLVFLGAGPLLRRSAQAELIQASFELGELQPEKAAGSSEDPAGSNSDHASPGKRPRPTPPPAAPPTLAEQLLTLTDVEQTAAKQIARVYEVKPAPERSLTFAAGTGPTISYVGVHYRAADLPESHDALLRTYRLPSGRDAETVWKKIREQLSTPQLKEVAGAPPISVPATRAERPLLPEVPLASPPLRDAQAGRHAMPLPTLLPSSPPIKNPLRIDASLRVHDEKGRVFGTAVLIRQHGLILELVCGADLCENEAATTALLLRALGRL